MVDPRGPSRASAPGKVILCGEHAVVYAQPAIALPVAAVEAVVIVAPAPGDGIVLEMPDIGEQDRAVEQSAHPFTRLAQATLAALGIEGPAGLRVTLTSTIPMASGMGSGAALGAALVKAVALHFGRSLGPAEVSALVYQSERFYHGTPSGIDNTVVSFGQPIWYRRDPMGGPSTIEPIVAMGSWKMLLGDTGVRAPTRATVGGVRERWRTDPGRYNRIFSHIGDIVRAARDALEHDQQARMGELLNENQALLQQIGVSSSDLDRLVAAANHAGALGAKLSGGGGGGIMLALVAPQDAAEVEAALWAAGATRVLATTLDS